MSRDNSFLSRWNQRRMQRGQRFRDAVAARPVLSALASAGLGAMMAFTSNLTDPADSSGLMTSAVGGAIGGFVAACAYVVLLLWIRKSRRHRDASAREGNGT